MKAVMVDNNDGYYVRNNAAEIEYDWDGNYMDWEIVNEEPLTGWEDDDGDWSRAVTYGNTMDGYYSEVTYFVED